MMNFVLAGFVVQICILFFLGMPFVFDMKWIPKTMRDVLLFGKSSENKPTLNALVEAIQIPKSYFKHFYWIAMLHMSAVILTLLYILILHNKPPVLLKSYINIVAPHKTDEYPAIDPEITMLVAVLFLIQVSRRLYESLFVTVFGNATMNVGHYLMGIYHYWGCITIILAYAVDWNNSTQRPSFGGYKIGFPQIIGVLLFCYASYQQFSIHKLLASYRKDFKKSNAYFLPSGGLFEYVSCPNFFCEILIYLSIFAIFGFSHLPWGIVCIFVTLNQTLAASVSHKWYRERFGNYPTTRKAIIPFIY